MSFLSKTFRSLAHRLPRSVYCNNPCRKISYLAVQNECVDDMIERYVKIFNRKDADGWDIRQAMNDLTGYDSVPEPKIVIAGLKACRRLNDYAMAVRFLEMVKFKCGNNVKTIWPYIVDQIKPTVTELGVDLPECLGYDEPELYMESVFDM